MRTKTLSKLTELCQKLNACFDKSEIRSLCFELGVDYDNLPEAKDDAIRELIRFLARHRQIEELIVACRRVRPHIMWPDIGSNEIVFSLESDTSQTKNLSREQMAERKKLLILLEKVKNFWIDGVLEKSAPEGMRIDLNWQTYQEAVDDPWEEERVTAVYKPHIDATNPTILDTFQNSDRALLILGEPGAGKTTTLLTLAQELIAEAEQDTDQPIPVVLKLTSWVESQATLLDWAVEELSTKYHIPRKIGRPWLEGDKLLLLLDGLAGVPDRQRGACIQAINQFRTDHGFTGLVVSCRRHEYESVDTKLKLGRAILLDTLTPAQIDAHLKAVGSQLSGLRNAIRNDAALQEMAQTPLMLHVMSVTYSNINTEIGDESDVLFRLPVPSEATTVAMFSHRQQLFAGYVRRMFQRHRDPPYSQEQTEQWLSWLAQRMSQHHQSIFQLEGIQPSWLSGRYMRWAYLLLTRGFTGLVIAILNWLFVLMGIESNFSFSRSGLYHSVADQLQIPFHIGALVIWVSLNTMIGLLVGLVDIYRFEHLSVPVVEIVGGGSRQLRYVFGIGMTVFTLTSLFFVTKDLPKFAIGAGLLNGLSWGVPASLFLFSVAYNSDIHPVEALQWSGKDALRYLPLGLGFGLGFTIVFWPLLETSTRWVFVVNAPLLVLLYSGLKPLRIESASQQNEGVMISLRNSLYAALLFSVFFGLSTTILLNSVRVAPIAVLYAGVGAASLYGGGEVLKHALVRLMLRWQNQVPLRFAPFLNHAAKLNLLHRVGGGYIFIHRLLQAYFSELDPLRGKLT